MRVKVRVIFNVGVIGTCHRGRWEHLTVVLGRKKIFEGSILADHLKGKASATTADK